MAAKQKIGTVLRVADRTARVRVDWKKAHRLYGKLYPISKSLQVDVSNDLSLQLGDTVLIEEIRPVSRCKAWRAVRVLEHASLADRTQAAQDTGSEETE